MAEKGLLCDIIFLKHGQWDKSENYKITLHVYMYK